MVYRHRRRHLQETIVLINVTSCIHCHCAFHIQTQCSNWHIQTQCSNWHIQTKRNVLIGIFKRNVLIGIKLCYVPLNGIFIS